MNEKELRDSLTLLGFKSNLIEEITESSLAHQNQIQTYLENLKMKVKSFNDLEWRIDVKLATKSLYKQIEPEIILKLNLNSNEQVDKSNKTEVHILQTDIVNLVHLTNSLDDALNEMKSNYCRRIFKNLI